MIGAAVGADAIAVEARSQLRVFVSSLAPARLRAKDYETGQSDPKSA